MPVSKRDIAPALPILEHCARQRRAGILGASCTQLPAAPGDIHTSHGLLVRSDRRTGPYAKYQDVRQLTQWSAGRRCAGAVNPQESPIVAPHDDKPCHKESCSAPTRWTPSSPCAHSPASVNPLLENR